MSESCIYEGWVRHRRHRPQAHHFRYRLFMMYLDLAELPQLFDRYWLWSADSGPAAARFRRRDHLGDPQTPLLEEVRNLIHQRTGRRLEGPVRLLTHLSYYGYCFNPVSFYYCFDAAGEAVDAIVAEVNNTPWGEQHLYVLQEENPSKGLKEYRHPKALHVSPFMEMDMEYRWRLANPGRRLAVHIENWHDGQRLFDASMKLSRRPINRWNLMRCLMLYPFMTGKLMAAIYWQALRLHLKRVRFVPHPEPDKRI